MFGGGAHDKKKYTSVTKATAKSDSGGQTAEQRIVQPQLA